MVYSIPPRAREKNMELRQLRYFVRIVELGSVSRAAKDLYVAQPALSAQMANLESELGVRLLARSVRGVTPTAGGKTLYLHAQAVLRQVDRLRRDVAHAGALPGGPVSVGMPTSAANVLAGPLIAAVQQRYPDIQLSLVESLSGHLRELVGNGRLEMSLLFEPAPPPGAAAREGGDLPHIHRVPLVEEELFLLSATPAPSARGGRVRLEDAAAMRLVLPGRANITRQLIDQVFAARGLAPQVMAELDSLSTIQAIVERGQAATILSLSSLVGEGARDRLSALSVGDPPILRRLSLCSPDIVAMGSAAESVAALVPELVRDIVAAGGWPGATMLAATEGP